MKYFIYIASFLYTISSFSQAEIDIIDNVAAGETDTHYASSLIEASNTIESNAIAIYVAGEAIQLNEGFFADLRSTVLISIQENLASSNSNQKEAISFNEPDLLANEFSIYPNPSNGIFNIQSSDNIISYSIKDLIGKQITTAKTVGNEFAINITNLASGFYVLELQKENGEIIKKKIIKN